MIGLTRKQADLLAFLKVREASGICPSFEEMKEHLGLSSKSGVHRLVAALEERGYIERKPDRARCIRVLEKPRSFDPTTAAVAHNMPTGELIEALRQRGYVVWNAKALAEIAA